MEQTPQIIKYVIIGLLCFIAGVLVTAISQNVKIKDISHTEMQVFPSYDWGEEDAVIFVHISANTQGTDDVKQQAIIDCLDYMWSYGKTAEDYIRYVDFKFYEKPTEHDYELLRLIIKQTWASEMEETN